jgi:hypothetical protein
MATMRRRPRTAAFHRPRFAGTLALGEVELEITPEPSEEERAAIAAALAQMPVEPGSAWRDAVLPHEEETA